MAAILGAMGRIPEAAAETMRRRLAHRGNATASARPAEEVRLESLSAEPGGSVYQSGDVSVAFAGAIYNVAELRAELSRCGIVPRTADPAELIASLYRGRGAEDFRRVNGDFAFALWDSSRNALLLLRDFFGCQPLYYALLPSGGVAFASEYKALLALDGVDVEPDPDMVQHLQNCKRLPLGRTLLKSIHAVRPGTLTTFEAGSPGPTQEDPFPRLKVEIVEQSAEAAGTAILDLLSRAIERRVAGRGAIGLTLSGGIDSIGMACLCRRLYPDRTIHTFTAGSGPEDFEITTAAQVARHIRSEHHEVITPPSLIAEQLHRLVWHLEDPYSRSESLQLLAIADAAREHVDTLFSGQGADGLFAGMPKYKLLWYMKLAPPLARPLQDLYAFTQTAAEPTTPLGGLAKLAVFRGKIPTPPRVRGATQAPSRPSFPPMGPRFLNETLAGGFQTGVCQDIQKFDRTFAARGITYQSPFYDPDLIRMAYTIPDRWKVRRGVQKYVFRRALRGLVPDDLLMVPKFPQRMGYDLEFGRALNALVSRYLSAERVAARGLFEHSDLRRLVRDPLEKPYSAEWGMRLWTAMLTEVWAEEFVEKRGAGAGPAEPASDEDVAQVGHGS
jgi:asparagine synthase (glutamine-hydrolysing)